MGDWWDANRRFAKNLFALPIGDIDPYPNFDLSKILRPGFEKSEELKTFVDILLLS